MKQHTTNYIETFIVVAEGTRAVRGTIPPTGKGRTVASLQYKLIGDNPYKYTSDDILFRVFADKNELLEEEYKAAREDFFSKGQPCLRASPLTKTYGFGIHSDRNAKVAIYGMETEEYQKFLDNPAVRKIRAMKSFK